mgnify:CR=1 FL=1
MLISQPLKGIKVYRTIFYIPAVVSGVATSVIWSWVLNSDYGVLNYLLSLIGIEGPNWSGGSGMGDSGSRYCKRFWSRNHDARVLYEYQRNFGRLYEAAALDGAGPVRQFFSITLPIITLHYYLT